MQRLDTEIQWLHGKGSEVKAGYAQVECHNAQGLINMVYFYLQQKIVQSKKLHNSVSAVAEES